MAAPNLLIDQVRREVTNVRNGLRNLRGLRKDWDELGGADFIKDHFTATDPTDATGKRRIPRTDLDVSAADIANAFASLDAVEAVLAQGHGSNLAKLRI